MIIFKKLLQYFILYVYKNIGNLLKTGLIIWKKNLINFNI